ncbi:DUF6400 family protein [Streptomyces sp. SD15]
MAPHDPPPSSDPDEAAGRPDTPALADFAVDLTSQEVLRQVQVLTALGPDWDPMEALHAEQAAHDLLYSGLDDEQQRLYDDLVAAGVLPARGSGHAAA